MPQLVSASLVAAPLPEGEVSSSLNVAEVQLVRDAEDELHDRVVLVALQRDEQRADARNRAHTTATSQTIEAIRERTALAPATTFLPVCRSFVLRPLAASSLFSTVLLGVGHGMLLGMSWTHDSRASAAPELRLARAASTNDACRWCGPRSRTARRTGPLDLEPGLEVDLEARSTDSLAARSANDARRRN